MKLHFLPSPGRVAEICLAVGLLACNLGLAQTAVTTASTLEPHASVRLAEALDQLPMNPYTPEAQRQQAPIRVRMPVWTEELGEVDVSKYTNEELNRMVDDFWTPERMKNAIPIDFKNPDDEFPMEFLKNLNYSELSSGPTIDPLITLASPAYPTVGAKKARPNGKVFFYNPLDNKFGRCSAAAVNGATKRIVATAAHCVHGGLDGVAYFNWKFIPNYNNGSEPDGVFRGIAGYILPDYLTYGGDSWKGMNADVAFVVTLASYDNTLVVDAVGGHGLTIGGNYQFNATLFGYPINIGNAEVMQRCDETTGIIQRNSYYFRSTNSCNFGHGSSGGPWLGWYNNDAGFGYLRGVTSWGDTVIKYVLYDNTNSPYFSYEVWQAYYYANNDTGWDGE